MARNYVSFTSDDAISNILNWVDEGNSLESDSDDGDDDLGDLYGEDIDMVIGVVHSDSEVDEEDGHHIADKHKDDHGSSESDSEEPPVKRPKKMLTSNRLVNSMDNSLDPTRYDEITLPKNTSGSNEVEVLTGYLGPKSNQATPKNYWTTDPPSLTGRQRLCNVIKSNIATVKYCNDLTDIRSIFHKLIDEEMIRLIVEKTNMKLDLIIERFSDKITSNSRYGFVRKTDTTEIYTLIGMINFRGSLGLNSHLHEILFSEKAGHPVFAATMSRNRFRL